jgi:hypothetical protein
MKNKRQSLGKTRGKYSPSDLAGGGDASVRFGLAHFLQRLIVFMYRRPTLCTLHIAVDFLKSVKIAVVWVEELLLGYKAYIISL